MPHQRTARVEVPEFRRFQSEHLGSQTNANLRLQTLAHSALMRPSNRPVPQAKDNHDEMAKRKPEQGQHTPPPPQCWEYDLGNGFVAYAGKTDADNDRISLRFASANDHWFHVKGMPGSHVVLKGEDGEPDRDLLKQAAAIAAYHSKARAGGTVAVNMTLAKYVTKPKGAQPGTVQIKRETTLKVKPALP